MRGLLFLPLFFCACGSAPVAASTSPTQKTLAEAVPQLAPAPRLPPAPPASVSFQLLTSESEATAEGVRFLLIALLSPPAGAHLFWKHSGETGLPTNVAFRGPPAVTIGPAQYPGPARFRSETGRVGYGYSGPVAIVAEVFAPKQPPPSAATPPLSSGHQRILFEAKGSWLSCDTRCIKEETRAHLSWSPRSPASVGPETLQRWLALLPVAGERTGWQAHSLDEQSLVVYAPHTWHVEELFPERDLGADERDVAVPATPLVPFRARFSEAPVPRSIVVRARSGDDVQFVSLVVNELSAQ